jgi:uncharacterized protein (TIGR02145 family)
MIEDAVTASLQSLFDAYLALEQNGGKVAATGMAGSPYFRALNYIPVFIAKLIDQDNYWRWTSYSDYVETMGNPPVKYPNKCRITLLDGGNSQLIAGPQGRTPCSTHPMPYVMIGEQIWTQTNLDVTTFRDGSPIPYIQDINAFKNTQGPAWRYAIDPNNQKALTDSIKYGKLYNSYAVEDSRMLAPAGWHIPTPEEWQKLSATIAINNPGNIGGAIMIPGAWTSVNANNNSGFSAIPITDLLNPTGTQQTIWYSTSIGARPGGFPIAYPYGLQGQMPEKLIFFGEMNGNSGYSVRLVKD